MLLSKSSNLLYVSNFEELISPPFEGDVNAICWQRELGGDFQEIVEKVALDDPITILEKEILLEMVLCPAGSIAREILLHDLQLLTDHGADPVLNIIEHYERDISSDHFATDVYSFHVDRSPVSTDTFLCTYYGEASEILATEDAIQKIKIPALRAQLKQFFDGPAEEFEDYLVEHFFDLHYEALPQARPVNLGLGQMWRLAVDYPGSPVHGCVHRAPMEHAKRLLLIC